jgi:hypothetical protein
MSMTPEYQAALDAMGRAADQMTRACDEYHLARSAAKDVPSEPPGIAALRVRCEEASAAHDEALADAWLMIEDGGTMDGPPAEQET